MTQSTPTISMPIPYSADVFMSNEGVRTQFCVKNYPNHATSASRYTVSIKILPDYATISITDHLYEHNKRISLRLTKQAEKDDGGLSWIEHIFAALDTDLLEARQTYPIISDILHSPEVVSAMGGIHTAQELDGQ